MLDFLLVLGQVPGTEIQLNFYEICLLGIVLIWFSARGQVPSLPIAKVHKRPKFSATNHARSFVLWMYFEFHKPL